MLIPVSFSREPASKLKSNSVLKKCLLVIACCCVTQILHVNIITGLGVMTIFIYKGLSRNAEIENPPV